MRLADVMKHIINRPVYLHNGNFSDHSWPITSTPTHELVSCELEDDIEGT